MPQVPQGRVNEQIAEIWSEVLGVSDPAHDSTFFDLGGHSLLAIRVMARVQERFAVDLPLAALFQHPTVNEFSTFLESVSPEINHKAAARAEDMATPSTNVVQPSLEQLLAKLDELTDDEAAQLLALLEEDPGGGGP